MLIAGIDEVGRGALAGPVVVGIVVADTDWPISKNQAGIVINDSKKLTQNQREKSSCWIYRNSQKSAIGLSDVSEINEHGIVYATHLAACRAWEKLKIDKIDLIKLDAFVIPMLQKLTTAPQEAIVKGDSISGLIASASIIAKVYRDQLMSDISKDSPVYFWDKNKGYGTRQHIEAIKRHGKNTNHRSLFVKKFC